MADPHLDPLRAAAPAYADVEAKRARAGVAAALFGSAVADEPERVAVGRYEIRSRLGAGGMGVVYRAHDPDLDRAVAVKLLHTDSSTDEKARARMLREARALAKLSHPNVITVFDVGTEDGQVFVAMELVAGLDLRRWLEHNPTAGWREVLELFLAAGRGLAAAHEAALIHRDFKPENVLIGEDGRVRVLDFGLARAHRAIEATTERELELDRPYADPDADDITKLSTAQPLFDGLTATGAMLGTPLYMAPELYAGKPANERSDQFAFCASLYESAYRQLPFGARTVPAHIEAVKAGRVVEPPVDSPVPITLWRILARGLAADPDARHPDMPSLLAELERVASEPAATELPGRGGSVRWLLLVSAVLFAVVGLVAAELGWFERPPAIPEPTEEPAPPQPASDPTPARATPAVEPIPAKPEPKPEPEPEPEPKPDLELDPIVEPNVGPLTAPTTEKTDWCHLHEDHFTLLERGSSKRSRFVDDGQCYVCRVERRSTRTQNFTPRDCAGYLLCGPRAPKECE